MDSVGNKAIYRKNPRAEASLLSAFTFAWTIDLFRRGFRGELTVSDLCEPLPEHTAHLLGNKFEELWNKELEAHKQNPKRRASLIRIILKVYGSKLLIYVAFTYVFQVTCKIGQPLFLSNLLEYFSPTSTMTSNEAKLYAGGVVLCILGHVVTVHPSIMALSHLGMKIRVAVCSLIYRKSLRLSKEANSNTGAGHVVNMLSSDASRFDFALLFLPDILMGPLITGVVAYVIWSEAGGLAVAGVAVFLVVLPISSLLAKRTSTLRYKIASKTDYRISLMSEIIAGIQVIKMYAWEKSFAKLVAVARKKEVHFIRTKRYTAGVLYAITDFSTKVALFVSLMAYASYTDVFRANVVFAMSLCYTIIEDDLLNFFPMAISAAAESFVAIRRMEAFLEKEEATAAFEQRPETSASVGEINIKDLCASWSGDSNTLEQLNVKIQPGSLVGVIGSVGSGKSSFLQLILREIAVTAGTIEVGGTVSYASQEPWLFGESVCQNILFGLPMDKEKYRTVIRVCALEADLKQLPNGDKTIIGDRGVCLSGGQKARVNLARAVYRDADIYLLDDPLSAVDTHVSRHLFQECVCGYLAGKTVVLATHHVHRLTNVGHIMKMEDGKIAAQGSFQELCDIGMDLQTMEAAPAPKEEKKELCRQTSRPMSLLDESVAEDVPKDSEMRSSGKVRASVYLTYLKSVKSLTLVGIVIASFTLALAVTSGSDVWLSFWVNQEEYGYSDISLPLQGELNRHTSTIIYGILISSIIVFTIAKSILYCVMVMRASTNLHDTMFRTISQATMNFFNNTPSGQILNRFSRDTDVIDEALTESLQECLRVGLLVVGSLVIIFFVNWYLILPFLVVALILYKLRQYYVATSRSIKRVEAITRSPMYTHVNASLQGLITIRAMGRQSKLQQEFDHKLDAHSSAWYFILGTGRTFGYYLDLTCFLFITTVTFSFIFWEDYFLGGDVGLAITQSMGLTFLVQWCIRQTAEVENQMTSVERVSEFGKVESENQSLQSTPDRKLTGWPSRGVVEFSDVSLFYDKAGSPVLKNISFDIKGGEKIGVVGRTGAGKSSLVAALFRLQKIEGNIRIDGIDTGTITLQDLRSKISIIPQDPVIFSGTMRFNLDPFEEYHDRDLWRVLEEVELKSIVEDSLLGLQMRLSEGGANLSVGQRQLVCLARAILRNSKVLVLDEATANVDTETDDFIQAAIRKRFAHCTVITIAHRLHTIMDSDRILVMDNGRVAEFGPPQVLLKDPNGHFTHLVGLADPITSFTNQSNNILPQNNSISVSAL